MILPTCAGGTSTRCPQPARTAEAAIRKDVIYAFNCVYLELLVRGIFTIQDSEYLLKVIITQPVSSISMHKVLF